MRYLAIICLLFFVFSIASAEPIVTREMPESVEINATFKVILNVIPDSESKIDIGEFIPRNWEIIDWTIYPEKGVEYSSQKQEFLGETRNMNHWRFESVSGEIKIEYTVIAKELGEHDFVTIWVYPQGFDLSSKNITVLEKENVEKQESNSRGGITGYFVQPIESPEILQKNVEFPQAKTFLNNVKSIIFGIKF